GQVDCSNCDLPQVSSPSPVEVVTGVQWLTFRCQGVLNVDKSITVVDPCASYMMGQFVPPNKITWLENSPLFVTKPGQWALDSAVGTLYYIPRSNENLATAEVVVPQLTHLIQANGLANAAFVGVRFSQTDWGQANTDVGFITTGADAFYTQVGQDHVD